MGKKKEAEKIDYTDWSQFIQRIIFTTRSHAAGGIARDTEGAEKEKIYDLSGDDDKS